jgi:hypothetical protein
MGNVQGRRHRRKGSKRKKNDKKKKELQPTVLVFIDNDDGEYIWENHVYGRLPFKEPDDVEIVFIHSDQLWQEDYYY